MKSSLFAALLFSGLLSGNAFSNEVYEVQEFKDDISVSSFRPKVVYLGQSGKFDKMRADRERVMVRDLRRFRHLVVRAVRNSLFLKRIEITFRGGRRRVLYDVEIRKNTGVRIPLGRRWGRQVRMVRFYGYTSNLVGSRARAEVIGYRP